MLSRGRLEREMEPVVVADEGLDGGHVPQEDLVEPPVPAQQADLLVEVEVRGADGGHVAGRRRDLDGPDDGLELVEDRRLRRSDDELRGATLDGGPHVVDLTHIGRGQADHERTASGAFDDESLDGQDAEGFPDRAPADVELGGDLGLDQVRPADQPAGQDLVAQDVGGVGRQASGGGQGWQVRQRAGRRGPVDPARRRDGRPLGDRRSVHGRPSLAVAPDGPARRADSTPSDGLRSAVDRRPSCATIHPPNGVGQAGRQALAASGGRRDDWSSLGPDLRVGDRPAGGRGRDLARQPSSSPSEVGLEPRQA